MKLSQERTRMQCRRPRFKPWVRKIPWGRKWQPTPVFFLPRESDGQRSLRSQRVGHNLETEPQVCLSLHRTAFLLVTRSLALQSEDFFIILFKPLVFILSKHLFSSFTVTKVPLSLHLPEDLYIRVDQHPCCLLSPAPVKVLFPPFQDVKPSPVLCCC